MSSAVVAMRAGLDRGLSAIIGGILIVIFCLNLYQVGGRYLFGVGAIWIPDLTRLLFIWMVFLGTVLIHQRKRHLVIDFLLRKFPRSVRRVVDAVIGAGMLLLAGVMAVVGWRIMQIRMDIPYTGLEIPTGYAYLAVPVAGALMAMTDLHDLAAWWQRRRTPGGDGYRPTLNAQREETENE
jgi:TRAP-type C4-dicarboxylate transport system permease small subunit